MSRKSKKEGVPVQQDVAKQESTGKKSDAAKAVSNDVPDRPAVGRPTEYKPEYCEQVEKLCRLGAKDEDIADFFEVSHTTVNTWKTKHPEFLASIKRGKVEADIAVANSLYKKATGYTIEVEKVVGKGEDKKVVKLNVAVEPDTTAAIFWLKNRRKEQWRDKQEVDMTVRSHEAALDELE